MTEKFNVGDRVYDICRGIGVVTSVEAEGPKDEYPLEVFIGGRHRFYTAEGKYDTSYANPALLTVPEARVKGYGVPREKVKKSEIRYGVMTQDGLNSSIFSTKAEAQKYALTCWWVKGISTITTEWEEEI